MIVIYGISWKEIQVGRAGKAGKGIAEKNKHHPTNFIVPAAVRWDSLRRAVPGLYHHALVDMLNAAGDDPLPVFRRAVTSASSLTHFACVGLWQLRTTSMVLDSAVFEVMVRRQLLIPFLVEHLVK